MLPVLALALALVADEPDDPVPDIELAATTALEVVIDLVALAEVEAEEAVPVDIVLAALEAVPA